MRYISLLLAVTMAMTIRSDARKSARTSSGKPRRDNQSPAAHLETTELRHAHDTVQIQLTAAYTKQLIRYKRDPAQ